MGGKRERKGDLMWNKLEKFVTFLSLPATNRHLHTKTSYILLYKRRIIDYKLTVLPLYKYKVKGPFEGWEENLDKGIEGKMLSGWLYFTTQPHGNQLTCLLCRF
jgi:hypothetical protein